jgi:hypothetical protein
VQLAGTLAADGAQPAQIHEPDRDREHDRRERGVRQEAQRSRQEQQHERDDGGRRELRDLAATARAFDHRRLRGRTVHDERA